MFFILTHIHLLPKLTTWFVMLHYKFILNILHTFQLTNNKFQLNYSYSVFSCSGYVTHHFFYQMDLSIYSSLKQNIRYKFISKILKRLLQSVKSYILPEVPGWIRDWSNCERFISWDFPKNVLIIIIIKQR